MEPYKINTSFNNEDEIYDKKSFSKYHYPAGPAQWQINGIPPESNYSYHQDRLGVDLNNDPHNLNITLTDQSPVYKFIISKGTFIILVISTLINIFVHVSVIFFDRYKIDVIDMIGSNKIPEPQYIVHGFYFTCQTDAPNSISHNSENFNLNRRLVSASSASRASKPMPIKQTCVPPDDSDPDYKKIETTIICVGTAVFLLVIILFVGLYQLFLRLKNDSRKRKLMKELKKEEKVKRVSVSGQVEAQERAKSQSKKESTTPDKKTKQDKQIKLKPNKTQISSSDYDEFTQKLQRNYSRIDRSRKSARRARSRSIQPDSSSSFYRQSSSRKDRDRDQCQQGRDQNQRLPSGSTTKTKNLKVLPHSHTSTDFEVLNRDYNTVDTSVINDYLLNHPIYVIWWEIFAVITFLVVLIGVGSLALVGVMEFYEVNFLRLGFLHHFFHKKNRSKIFFAKKKEHEQPIFLFRT